MGQGGQGYGATPFLGQGGEGYGATPYLGQSSAQNQMPEWMRAFMNLGQPRFSTTVPGMSGVPIPGRPQTSAGLPTPARFQAWRDYRTANPAGMNQKQFFGIGEWDPSQPIS